MPKSKSNPDIEINAKVNSTEWKEWAKQCNQDKANKSSHGAAGASGGLYFLGFVGSLIYWMQAAGNFGAVVTGILKSLVWPTYIVYKLLEGFYGVVR